MQFRKSILALATFALLSPAALAASIVTNGSFESGNYGWDGNGADSLQPGSTTITGWTVATAELAAINTPNNFGIPAQDGIISLDLTGYHDSPAYSGVMQNLTTEVGATYELTFWVASVNQPSAVNAYANATLLGTGTSPAIGSGIDWNQNTFDFVATSANTNLQLLGATASNGTYIGLDNVAVTKIADAVPEPTSLALLIPSVSALLSRRRKQF